MKENDKLEVENTKKTQETELKAQDEADKKNIDGLKSQEESLKK